ncbi:MAG: hypothetical protein AAB267_08070 [Candidatus Desantisbacteria bacterium]
MAEKKVCPTCGQAIKEKKPGLILPVIIGTVIWLLITIAFNKYYFAGSGFWDTMPAIHLFFGVVLGITSGLIIGFILRKNK